MKGVDVPLRIFTLMEKDTNEGSHAIIYYVMTIFHI